MYFFGILDNSNQQIVAGMAKQKKDLQALQAQNQSYLQAKADLKQLADQAYQPEDFFSRDISLVNELRVLEGLKQKMGVQMQISGISGTIANAPRAKTITPLVYIHYGITVTGSLSQVVDFIETLENLSFITNVSNVSITAADKGQVNAGMSADFYLRK